MTRIYGVRYECGGRSGQEAYGLQKKISRWLQEEVFLREGIVPEEAFRIQYTSHGKPILEKKIGGQWRRSPLQYNLTHCSGLVCCGLGPGDLGLDAEPVRPYDSRLAARVCTRKELADIQAAQNPGERFIAYWTLKESLVKFLGVGLSYGLNRAVFSFQGAQPCCESHPRLRMRQTRIQRADNSCYLALCQEGGASAAFPDIQYLQPAFL